jgi:HTH-type transcriptional repressor of NAD biosynthesis genes
VHADVKRICLLGAESTGKTTLARSLALEYGDAWNPEYGRPYTELGRDPEAPWTSAEFTRIARIQCWYEDCLAETARRALFCDTDAFTTALFHEVYLGAPTRAFDDLVGRAYDLYLVCGLDIPWRHDGIREFEEQRHWMHDRYLARARASESPWLLVEGSAEDRLARAKDAVDHLLSGAPTA